jgi:peptidoglycan hydrolase-like protein with peptidoglycan-binding domain
MLKLAAGAGALSAVVVLSLTPAAAQSSLRLGDEGPLVQWLQVELKNLGFEVATNGRFDAATEVAVEMVQAGTGLAVDGVAGPRTLQILRAAALPPVEEAGRKLELTSPRMFGNDVRAAQELLNRAGYSLDPDGVYGTGMASAVRDFQASRGLRSDGRIGPDTWRALRG